METLAIAPQRHLVNVQRSTFLSNRSQCFSMGRKSSKIASFQAPHLTHSASGPREFTCQRPSLSSQPSFHCRRFVFLILYYGTASSQTQNCPFPLGDPDLPYNTRLLGPTWAHIPNGISIGPSVFCRIPPHYGHTDTHTNTKLHGSSNRPHL